MIRAQQDEEEEKRVLTTAGSVPPVGAVTPPGGVRLVRRHAGSIVIAGVRAISLVA